MVKIRKNVKLARYTTFHVGGKAEFFAEVKSVEELEKAVDFAKRKKLKIFVLGGGSNVLLLDKGLRGLVLKINIGGISFKDNILSAGAGEIWDKVVARAVAKNLGGIENLSLIPGTVGGAVYQNIGAYGAEIKDTIDTVDIFDIRGGKIKRLRGKDCKFGYRASIFQRPEAENYIILKTQLKLSKNFTPNLKYPDLIKYFGLYPKHDRGINTISKITLKQVRNAVIKIRRAKLVYPTKNTGTAGSFFKNPVITSADFEKLLSDHPDIKGRNIGDGLVKLSAGQLIEQAGWKGTKSGNAGVSQKHALVLVSYKEAGSKDILNLAQKIQKSVKVKFGITLEPEVQIVTSG